MPKPAPCISIQRSASDEQRAAMNGHHGAILWMTGLPAAGKSTIAARLERALFDRGYQVFVLDGDNVRQGLNADLDFSREDRTENIRRVGEVAALFAEAGLIVITAFISPYRADRERVRARHARWFHEIHVDAPLEVCEARDPKGLYKKARAGELQEFTGVSAPYEPPVAPDVVLSTDKHGIDECVTVLARYVRHRLSVGTIQSAAAAK